MKIEVRSAPHRKIAVADILKNPHRDLNLNPIVPEKVEGLIESYERTGFWDNIVVREHPTREGKYQLAYGHNRLAALNDKRVVVDTITIPVAKLTDWEMYCAMVDENELSGKMTPPIIMENVNVGCDLIEGVFKNIGKSGTYEQFGTYVPTGTHVRNKHDGTFERVRDAFFAGEGIGRVFLVEHLPCGKLRGHTITEVINTRYGEMRAKAKEEQAKAAAEEAAAAKAEAAQAKNAEAKQKANDKAKEKAAEAKALEAEAAKIGRGIVAKEVLLMFGAARTMTDFAAAVRKLGIPPEYHVRAAKQVIKEKVREEKIERELSIWWDEASGAAAARRKAAEKAKAQEKLRELIKGTDFTSFLLKIGDDLLAIKKRLDIAIQYVDQADERGHKAIENKIVPVTNQLNDLIERSRAVLSGPRDITPGKKMLTHQKAS